MIKSIQTEYNGYLFRSRLEARYAVFLNSLHIRWEYEVEGFILDNGEWYLPDFYLPDFDGGMWMEVKPTYFNEQEKERCRLLCLGTKKSVWLANGTPNFTVYEVFYFDEHLGVIEGDGMPNADQAEHENRMYGMTSYGEAGQIIEAKFRHLVGDTLSNAVLDARQARFEFINK